ncbi:helix-turn-helix domain-containing protein, partial [Candidatus Roizmanbacteria bacterium]|nr:helix-turn-helix domain-containing protein [Candidatus Roizmanbacteria bacterium]
ILKKERERLGINLHQVEQKTRIRERFLSEVETNRWDSFSSVIYITGIIKTYAEFLNLDSAKLLAFFRRDYERKEDIRFKQKVSRDVVRPETRKVASVMIGIIILFFLFYFSYQISLFISPPQVQLLSPNTGRTNAEKVTLTGKTDKDAAVTIFGERVFPNKEGIFIYELPLHPGANSVVIEVIGANGKKTIIKKTFTRS